LDLNYISS